jgi:S1-C subfamily serine protease
MDASIGLVRALLPATVALRVQIPSDHRSVAVLGDERMGSAVMVEPGVALTVNYVVMGGRSIRATFPDGESCQADILAQDFESGLAALRLSRRAGAVAVLGDSRAVRKGQEVFVLASTGATERRVSNGVVTDLGPFDAYWEYMLESAIQCSAINPGFGGGPLFDNRGRLLGITSLSLGQVGRFSLAVPVHLFSDHRQDLLRFGRVPGRARRAWVGIYAEPAAAGVVVSGLVPDGPADRAGIQEGDVVVAVDFAEVATREEMYRHLWERSAGAVVRLGVLRKAARLVIDVSSIDRAEFYR